ncbi:MAG: ABC transporter permease [Deinococcales bacterium]
MRARLSPGLLIGTGLVLMLLLVLPTLALLLRAARPELAAALLDPTVTAALRLSLATTGVSLLATVLFGTPVAYLLARFEFRGKVLLEALLDLPLVLPPVVAGLALLLLLGRRGLLGAPLADLGVHVAFTSTAVVLAQLFVASPLYIRSMKAAFRSTPRSLEAAAITLHASRLRAFRRVTLPLTLPAFVEGCVLTWTRALGEFGATIVVAGSLAGRTQTMPLAIYAELERNLDVALAMGAILTLAAFALLLLFRRLTRSA